MKACRVPLTIVLLALPVVAAAQRGTQIRLATIAPDNSVWVDALKQMGSEWQRATNGRVSLNVFPGGAAGDEPTVLRKLRLGNPNAAALTQPGLSEIDEAFNVFGIPFFFTSDEELVYVLEKLEPTLKDVLQQKGLALVHWGHGGWAHLFSAQQIRSIDDLKRAKIFTSAGDGRNRSGVNSAGRHSATRPSR